MESQIDLAEAAEAARSNRHVRTQDEIERDTKLHALALSRTRVTNDLKTATNPRYRLQLEQALAYLDQQIAAIETPGQASVTLKDQHAKDL